jgi:3-hydroxyisobutyrate dehydrogenase-like beta-hydroxyacid dehydrogenase
MRITLIGSGNVATHLGAAFKNAGHRIVQVYSRNAHNAALLAYHIGAEAIDDLNNIDPNTDIFIISVSDDAIAGIAQELSKHNKANSPYIRCYRSCIIFLAFTDHAGVFYPLQTFSKTKEVDFLTSAIMY